MKKVIIIAVVCLFAVSLFAEFDFYSSIRTGWWYKSMNKEYLGGEEGRMEMVAKLNSSSRLGVNFKKEGFCANVEMGLSTSGIYLRKAYIQQDLGGFKLLAGQTYTGFNDFAAQAYGNGGETYLMGYGMMYDGRRNMIKATFANGFYFSLIEPVKMGPVGGCDEIDALIPKVNLGAHLTLNDLELHPTIGYAMSSYNEDFSQYDETVTAFAAAVTAKYKVSDICLKGQFGYGQNIGDYGFSVNSNNYFAKWDSAKEEVLDATAMNAYLQGTFQLFTGGFGYVAADHDGLEDPDATMTYFVQYKLKIGEYLCMIPEVGMINYMEDGMGNEEGAITYFGASFRADMPK